MSATFAIVSGTLITIVVCATTCALFLPSAQTHRVWAARWARVRAARAQTRAARAARALARAQTRAARAQTRAQVQTHRARAAWRDAMIKG